jgi:hypothetical protein
MVLMLATSRVPAMQPALLCLSFGPIDLMLDRPQCACMFVHVTGINLFHVFRYPAQVKRAGGDALVEYGGGSSASSRSLWQPSRLRQDSNTASIDAR